MSIYPERIRSPTFQQQNDAYWSNSAPARPVLGDRWRSTTQLSYVDPFQQSRYSDGLNHHNGHPKGRKHIHFDPTASEHSRRSHSAQPCTGLSVGERPVTPPMRELPISPVTAPVHLTDEAARQEQRRSFVNAVPIYEARHYTPDVRPSAAPTDRGALTKLASARPRPLSDLSVHHADVYGKQLRARQLLESQSPVRSDVRSRSSQTRPPFVQYNAQRTFNALVPRALRSDVFGYPVPLPGAQGRLDRSLNRQQYRSRSAEAHRPAPPKAAAPNPKGTPVTPEAFQAYSSPLSPGEQLDTMGATEGFGTLVARRSIPLEQQSRFNETTRRAYIPVETCVDAIPETSAQEIGWVHNNHVLTKDHVITRDSLRTAEGVVHARKAVEETGHSAVVAQHLSEEQAGETLLAGHRVHAKHYEPADAKRSRPALLAKHLSRPFTTWHPAVESGVQVEQPGVQTSPGNRLPVSLGSLRSSSTRSRESTRSARTPSGSVNPQAVTLRWPVLAATSDGHTVVQGVATNPPIDKGLTVAECLHWFD